MDILHGLFRKREQRPDQQREIMEGNEIAERVTLETLEEWSCHPLFETKRDDRNWQDNPRLRDVGSIVYGKKILDGSDPIVNQKLLRAVANLKDAYGDWPCVYAWKAEAHAGLAQYDDACRTISVALQRCEDKGDLCYTMGMIKLYQSKIESFGWFMQACMLAYEDVYPYLFLSVAASEMRMSRLRNRLLNACDIWFQPHVWRPTPKDEKRLRDLSRRTINVVPKALQNFEGYMETVARPPTYSRAGSRRVQKI